MQITTAGNAELLQQSCTCFLSSRELAPPAILRCYEWAIEQKDNGATVICGCHSTLEKDVIGFLLKGTQPVIITLARSLYKTMPVGWLPHIEAGRLLVVSPLPQTVTRAGTASAVLRNKYMIEHSTEVVVGFATPGGNLEKLLHNYPNKPIRYLFRRG